MDEEDLVPLRPKPDKKDLETMSIERLGHYVAELEAEIARAREMIAAKKAVRGDADALFGD